MNVERVDHGPVKGGKGDRQRLLQPNDGLDTRQNETHGGAGIDSA